MDIVASVLLFLFLLHFFAIMVCNAHVIVNFCVAVPIGCITGLAQQSACVLYAVVKVRWSMGAEPPTSVFSPLTSALSPSTSNLSPLTSGTIGNCKQ